MAAQSAGNFPEQSLLNRLVSQDWRERQEAIETLTALAGQGELDRLALARALILIVRENHSNMSALNSSMQVLEQIGQPVSLEIIALLYDDDLDLRIYVPLVLGHLGGEEVIAALIHAALDQFQPENVRFNAIEALGMLRAGQAVPAMLEILSTGTAFLRYGAVSTLGAIGWDEAANALEPLLNDPYLCEPAVLALGSCGCAENIPAICSWLEEKPSGARVAVSSISAIARRAHERAEAEEAFTSAYSPRLREILLGLVPASTLDCKVTETSWADLALLIGWLLLVNRNDREAHEALARLLGCPAARAEAAAALIRSPGPIPEALIEMAQEANTEQALAAVHVLAGQASTDALPVLMAVLNAQEEALAITALHGLGKILEHVHPGELRNADAAAERLIDLLQSGRNSIRHAAVEVLCSLKNWEIEDRAIELLNHPDPLLRTSAMQLLAKMDLPAAMRAAVAARNDPAPEVRRIAIELLPRSPQPQAVDFLRQALRDPDASSRRAAAQACAELPGGLAVDLLDEAAKDPDRWVRLQAARGLSHVSVPEGLRVLSGLAQDPFPPVRTAAVEAAGHIAHTREWQAAAMDILTRAAADEDAAVRQAAQTAIKSILPDTKNGS